MVSYPFYHRWHIRNTTLTTNVLLFSRHWKPFWYLNFQFSKQSCSDGRTSAHSYISPARYQATIFWLSQTCPIQANCFQGI